MEPPAPGDPPILLRARTRNFTMTHLTIFLDSTGPITATQYERFQSMRERLGKQGFDIPLPTGNQQG
jgi:hypothetical protein